MPISEQVLRDLREIVASDMFDDLVFRVDPAAPLSPVMACERLVFRTLPALLDEVESLRDSTLAKDFLALYQSARMLTSGWVPIPGAPSPSQGDVEHLGMQVRRLAPLYDDVRMQLNLRSQVARDAHRQALGGPLPSVPFVLRGAVPARPGQPRRSEVDPSVFDEVNLTVAPQHTVRVMRDDGSESVECDHTFKGTRDCVHCGTTVDELIARTRAEAARLPSLLPAGVLHASPGELAEAVQRQLDEHEGAGIINALHGVSELDAALEPDDELAVPVTLGPSLRPRVEALVATGRLGRDIEHVVQTLFVLGMLDAEGQDPQAHVGEPHSHVSAEALFVRFGLPHEGGEHATRQRASILRQLLLDLSEWCDEADPLRPAFAAALELLPR